jgi:hypothetical protein
MTNRTVDDIQRDAKQPLYGTAAIETAQGRALTDQPVLLAEIERLARELIEASIQADTNHRMMLMEREIAATEVRDRGTAERERDEAQQRANRYAGQIGEMTGELAAARAPAPPSAGVGSALIAELRAQHDSCIHPHGTIEAPDEVDDCDMCNLRDVLRRAAATIERQCAQLAAKDAEIASCHELLKGAEVVMKMRTQSLSIAEGATIQQADRACVAEMGRDALAAKLRELRDWMTPHGTHVLDSLARRGIDTALSQALSGQPDPLTEVVRWVSVEERLPEDERTYPLLCNGGVVYGTPDDDELSRWHINSNGASEFDVTHWCDLRGPQLPAAPTATGTEDKS